MAVFRYFSRRQVLPPEAVCQRWHRTSCWRVPEECACSCIVMCCGRCRTACWQVHEEMQVWLQGHESASHIARWAGREQEVAGSRKWNNAASFFIPLDTRLLKSALLEPAGSWQIRVCRRSPQVSVSGKCSDWRRVGVASACPRTGLGGPFLQI